MQTTAELSDKVLIVKKTRDASRLYSKSRFGTPLPGNQLQLDLLEGVFLRGERKLRVFHGKKELDFQRLITMAAREIPEFEIKYLIYRDLRKRGYHIKLSDEKGYKNIHFCIYTQGTSRRNDGEQYCVTAFSERDILNIDETKGLIQMVEKQNRELWFAIVDEEGDITYYAVSLVDLRGEIHEHAFPKGTGVLLENRVVLFDKPLVDYLSEKEFFGKRFGEGLQLSLVEALYLFEKKVLAIRKLDGTKLTKKGFMGTLARLQPDIASRLVVFRDLKTRGLIVKTGFKFGAHFRAYTRDPDETHAEFLVHVVKQGFQSIWAEMSRAVRLAHSVNKEIVFARIEDAHVDYVRFGRLRP